MAGEYLKNMKATIQILFMLTVSLLVTESGYAQSGALEWAKKANGTLNDNVSGIALDDSGNILLTGDFRGTITFGAGEVNETTLEGGYGLGDYDIFVAKYTPSGVLLWAKKEDGSSFSWGRDIATDADGNILLTGDFRETITYGAGEANGGDGNEAIDRGAVTELAGVIGSPAATKAASTESSASSIPLGR